MRKLIVFALCLSLLTGCISVPAYGPAVPVAQAMDSAAPSATAPQGPSRGPETAAPAPQTAAAPEVKRIAAPTDTPQSVPGGAEETPPEPSQTPEPRATALPTQTYTGGYFRFLVPGSWLRANAQDGVFFFPERDDTQNTFLLYQETDNTMKLTETTLDIALMFSSAEAVTAMVEGALANSGMTGFSLSPVSIKKTKLNGLTCYRGASNITAEGQTYDFVGHIFLRGDRMVLLVWVGDETQHAAGLQTVHDSFQEVK